MKIELSSPKLIDLEVKCISLLHKLSIHDIESSQELAEELRLMIVRQRELIHHEWKSALFELANKL